MAKDRFRLLRPLLQALRAKDYAALHLLGDVLPVLPRPRVLPSAGDPNTTTPAQTGATPPAAPTPADDREGSAADGGAQRTTAHNGGADGGSAPARTPKRARSRPRTLRGPAGSLPHIVTEALANDRSAHEALHVRGLICNVLARPMLGAVAEARVGDTTGRAA